MIDHVSSYTTNFPASKTFYEAALAELGYGVQAEMVMDSDPDLPGSRACAFGHDGRAIFYDFAGRIFRAPVLSPGVFGVPEALPAIAGLVDWDLAPDGRLLVVRTPPGSVQHSVKVVLNWTEELLRRRE